MKYIIEEKLYDELRSILDNYYGLLEHLDEYRNKSLTDDFYRLEEALDEYESLPIYENKAIASKEYKLAVGDNIRVIDNGECYPSYSDWVERYIIEPSERYLWNYSCMCHNGDIGRVLFIAPHEDGTTQLAYIKMNNEKCYLIGIKGLEKI